MQDYGTTLWDLQENRRNSKRNQTMTKKERSVFISGRKRFGTSTSIYSRPPQRYQGYTIIQYRKNFLHSTEWNPKNLWDWLKKQYILQNFASRWSALDKLYTIRHSECKNISKYMSWIKDVFAKIEGLKISISKIIIIHTLNNLDLHFWSYFVILRYNTQQKKAFLILNKPTKTLKNEQMRFSNNNRKGKQTILEDQSLKKPSQVSKK